MAKRAIITGISGFVGGFLAENLIQSGAPVLGFSPSGQWLSTSPGSIQGRAALSAWDLAKAVEGDAERVPATICREIERFEPEVVYHLAAMSVPSDCGENEPTDMAIAVNVEGTRRVVEAVLSAAPSARLVFVSSSHVYSPVDPTAPQVDESAPVAPVRGYGKTKLAGERVVLEAVERNGLDAVVVRAFQHTGPRQVGRMMLPEWVRQVVDSDGGPIYIHTRDARIDLLDVRDVVRAYEALAESGRSGTIYNVGSGKVSRTGDLIDRLLEIAGVDAQVIETQPGEKQDPVADITRIQHDMDWQPRLSIDRTFSDTLTWWREK